MSREAAQQSAERVRAAVSLLADAATAELATALQAEGVRSVVLKGPALAEWLYADGAERTYGDADLLVCPADVAQARRVLEARGFELQPEQLPPAGEAIHAEPFVRGADGAAVDLHRSLFGCGVPPAWVWPVVSAGTVRLRVAGTQVEAPALPVRALVVVLHAAQHGPDVGKPVEDLRRALAVADRGTWDRAAALARQLHAELPFATGLALAPEGHGLARELGLIDPAVARDALGGSGPNVLGMNRVMSARGARSKLRLLARELVPPPAELRWQDQSQGRPQPPLALAYVRRLGRLLRHAPASLRAVRRSYAAGAGSGAGARSRPAGTDDSATGSGPGTRAN